MSLAQALRLFGRRPGFAAVAILLIALGTGANVAVFAVVRGVWLAPLPFTEPGRLVAVWPGEFVTADDVEFWRARARTLTAVAGISPGWMMGLVAEGRDSIKVTGARVSDELFTLLGTPAALGRALMAGDGTNGRHRVVVLSHRLWQRYFAGDPDAIGRTIALDDEPFVIVGVMPPAFEVMSPATDLWVPIVWTPGGRGPGVTVLSVARLAPGSRPEAATRELQALLPELRRATGRSEDWARALTVQDLADVVTRDARPALLILLGAVGVTLLLASANLATLVLGRALSRRRELAVRVALGASRGALVRDVVVEQAVLAAAGSIAGLIVGGLALPMLVAVLPADVPRADAIAIDGAVLALLPALVLLVTVATAVPPAMSVVRPAVQPLIGQARGGAGAERHRVLGTLVVAQVALAVVLGVAALLMVRSLWNLEREQPGFAPESVLTFRLQTTARYRTLASGLPYLQQVIDRVRALPGVTAVGTVAHLPLGGYAWTIPVRRADQPPDPATRSPLVGWRFVGWDYFAAMRIPFLHGRPFDATDTTDGRPVAIVNETLARQLFGAPARAVGSALTQSGGGRAGEQEVTIVGVVGDVRHAGLGEAAGPEFYRPLAQTFMFPMAFVVRTSGEPSTLAAAVRQAAGAVDGTVPVAELQTYRSLVRGSLSRPRLLGGLLSAFAGVGLLLAMVGVYGVLAYRVRQRQPEIGIRLALGATPARIRREILRQGARDASLGLAVGVPAALGVSGLLASEVYGLAPRDPLTIGVLVVLISLTTLLAGEVPARRAASVDPVAALRGD